MSLSRRLSVRMLPPLCCRLPLSRKICRHKDTSLPSAGPSIRCRSRPRRMASFAPFLKGKLATDDLLETHEATRCRATYHRAPSRPLRNWLIREGTVELYRLARLTAWGWAASDLCARMTSTASRTWAQRRELLRRGCRPRSGFLKDVMQNSLNIATLFTVAALSMASGGRAQSGFDLEVARQAHRSAHPHRSRCALRRSPERRAILENCSFPSTWTTRHLAKELQRRFSIRRTRPR